jgi:hypothetical protein
LEDWKIKIAALWFFYTMAMLAVMTLMFYGPGIIDEIRSGTLVGEALTGEHLLMTAVVLLVPLVMAVLSLTLKDSINRWANIIVGIVFTILSIVSLILAFTLDLSIYAFGLLLDISMVVTPALVVWYAWKSKQQA